MSLINKPILYKARTDELTCPNCGSHNVYYTVGPCFIHWNCNKCKYHTNNIIRTD